MKIGEFFDMIFLNEYHTLRIKSEKTDEIITTIRKVAELDKSELADKEIKGFATDWISKVYILWI